MKLLQDVQYVPGLAHNLLSVGQLLSRGYDVVLKGYACSIVEWSSGVHVAKMRGMAINMFPLTHALGKEVHVMSASFGNKHDSHSAMTQGNLEEPMNAYNTFIWISGAQ